MRLVGLIVTKASRQRLRECSLRYYLECGTNGRNHQVLSSCPAITANAGTWPDDTDITISV